MFLCYPISSVRALKWLISLKYDGMSRNLVCSLTWCTVDDMLCLQNDFTSADFADMPAPLAYNMFKMKTEFPLHTAIRTRREDVVFLYLVEHDSQVFTYCLCLSFREGRLSKPVAVFFNCRNKGSIW